MIRRRILEYIRFRNKVEGFSALPGCRPLQRVSGRFNWSPPFPPHNSIDHGIALLITNIKNAHVAKTPGRFLTKPPGIARDIGQLMCCKSLRDNKLQSVPQLSGCGKLKVLRYSHQAAILHTMFFSPGTPIRRRYPNFRLICQQYVQTQSPIRKNTGKMHEVLKYMHQALSQWTIPRTDDLPISSIHPNNQFSTGKRLDDDDSVGLQQILDLATNRRERSTLNLNQSVARINTVNSVSANSNLMQLAIAYIMLFELLMQ